MRGIVAELPSDFPLKIVDEFGHHHRGVYILSLLIRNRGSEAILPSSFVESSPLRVILDENAHIIVANCFTNDDDFICSVDKLDDRTVSVDFDCVNPSDFINLVIFYGGKAMTSVRVTGRIIGQEESIDQTAEEVRAATGERVTAFIVFLMMLNSFTGLPISLWLIYRDYGLGVFLKAPIPVPTLLLAPAGLGISILSIFLMSRVDRWLERRKYPDGFPLRSDFEPPVWEAVKGLARTAFLGKKQRYSSSLFSWAEPVIFHPKKSRRRTVDDWLA
ncbi:hypothetical protein C5614_14685 [Massilia phosphatilytica]|nr:hypothetical protein C5614_14685 [Massilia phosphatilytica]